MNFHGQISMCLAAFGDTPLQKQAANVLLGAASRVPSLPLAPFFTFFLRDGQRFPSSSEARWRMHFERSST
jgi:hypothetical protein